MMLPVCGAGHMPGFPGWLGGEGRENHAASRPLWTD
jgi:hypothetical protein